MCNILRGNIPRNCCGTRAKSAHTRSVFLWQAISVYLRTFRSNELLKGENFFAPSLFFRNCVLLLLFCCCCICGEPGLNLGSLLYCLSSCRKTIKATGNSEKQIEKFYGFWNHSTFIYSLTFFFRGSFLCGPEGGGHNAFSFFLSLLQTFASFHGWQEAPTRTELYKLCTLAPNEISRFLPISLNKCFPPFHACIRRTEKERKKCDCSQFEWRWFCPACVCLLYPTDLFAVSEP